MYSTSAVPLATQPKARGKFNFFVTPKEYTVLYISVIEGTAVYCTWYCTTCPFDRAGGERLGESNICKTMKGAVPSITDKYIFFAHTPVVVVAFY